MDRRRTFFLVAMLIAETAGCGGLERRSPAGPADGQPRYVDSTSSPPRRTWSSRSATRRIPDDTRRFRGSAAGRGLHPAPLAENRTVQAAYHNVQSLRHRLPQVTALDDPVASNAVFPIPSVAPQYS